MSHLHTVCKGHVSPQHSLSRTCLTSTQFVKDMSHLHTVCKGHISPQHSLSRTCHTFTQCVKDMSHLNTVCQGHVTPSHSVSRTYLTSTRCIAENQMQRCWTRHWESWLATRDCVQESTPLLVWTERWTKDIPVDEPPWTQTNRQTNKQTAHWLDQTNLPTLLQIRRHFKTSLHDTGL